MVLRSILLSFLLCCLVFFPSVQSDDIEYTLMVNINRPSYGPGYTVYISGLLTFADGTPAPYEYVGVQITSPDSSFDCFQPATDDAGMYSVTYPLNVSVPLGTYSVDVAKGYARANVSFDVIEQVPNLPPYPPSYPSPSNESSGVSTSVLLSWSGGDSDPDDSVTYTVFLGGASLQSIVSENQTDTSFPISDLDYETTYYWRITSYDSYGHRTQGPLWMFTTKASGNNVPVAPSNLQGITTGYHGTAYEYTVSTVDYDNDTVYYQFNWGDGTYSLWLGPYPSGQLVSTNHTWNIPGSYSVSVWAKDVHDAQSNWSLPLSVTMQNRPPRTPTYPIPSNGSTNRAVTLVLRWVGGDPDNGDIVLYDVYFGSSFPLEKMVTRQANTSFDPMLSNGVLYYWQVVAWDNFNESATGPLWHFQTMSSSSGGPSGSGDDSSDDGDEVEENTTHIPPVAFFTISSTTGHPFESITLDASQSTDDGYIARWLWDFGDGATGIGEIVTHYFSTVGTYTVRLTVEDNDNNLSETSNVITILPFVLFTVDITMENDTVVGDTLLATVDILNIGEPLLMNISIMCSLHQDIGIVWSETEQVTVFEKASFTKSIDTSSFLPGSYHFSVSIVYQDDQIVSESVVVILSGEQPLFDGTSWIILLIGFITAIFVASAIIGIRGRK